MVNETRLVRCVENVQVTKQELQRTELWEHAKLEDGTKLNETEFRQTYNNFVLGLNGVDTDFKTMALYTAVHKELSDQSQLQMSACNGCGHKIDPSDFAEEFVDAYHRKMVSDKLQFTGGIARNAYNLARRNWLKAIKNLTQDIFPAVRSYISTNPKKINEDKSFP